MKTAIYTVDCYKGREHLMPWRTILEVAKVMRDNFYDVVILNACNDEKDVVDYEWCGVSVVSVLKNDDEIQKKCQNYSPDVLFIPFTFRDGLKPAKWISQITCKKIGYMAGGVYDFHSGAMLYNVGGLSAAKPYLMESIAPQCVFSKTLKKIGICHVIGLTDTSSDVVRSSGFENVTTIFPAKDSFAGISPDNDILIKYGLLGKKWLLFSGAPAPTRGAEVLLKSVDLASDETIRLVMLMRSDVGSVYDSFENTLVGLKHPERVVVIKENISREQLRAFFGNAWYALLPFIVIPSEIPLTYFEFLSCGTPIVTFKNGGTTEYLKDGLLIAEKSVKGLSKALDKAWSEDSLRDKLANNGLKIMENHPTWEQVGMEWIKLLNN